MLSLLLLLLIGQFPAPPQAAAAPAAGVRVTVSAETAWNDTGIALKAGDKVVVATEDPPAGCPPEGARRSWADLLLALPVNSAGRGALVGRIGDETSVAFLVGSRRELTATQDGRFYLGLNQPANQKSTCSFKTRITVEHAAATPAAPEEPAPAIPADLLDQLPRRVVDAQGNDGDMVNFLLVGPREKVEAAFRAAGWTQVDRTKREAVLHAVIASISKQAYTEMPMSELYLFGRAQDYGFARAEPVQVVLARHHLRVWRTEFDLGGQEVWAGAATHDVGLERDRRDPRRRAVTHKIDPEVDKEREYLRQTFQAAGALRSSAYASPSNPVRDAKTATGGEFHSDGRILVLYLR